jgi:hypothetical protein
MREPKDSWVAALRALTGNEKDGIRFNEALSRWEFMLTSADGIMRSQFWCQFKNPLTGEAIEPDVFTGLQPFRELDDDGMIEALANLESTFVGNPHDGAGTTYDEVTKRIEWNRDRGRAQWRQGGEDFASMATTTAGRGRRLRGALATGHGGTVGQRSRRLPDSSKILK